MIKVVELFSGIGSQTQALKNIGIEHEIVNISEWSINSIISYGEIHSTSKDYDVSRQDMINELNNYTFSLDTKTVYNIKNLKDDKLKLLYKNHKNSNNLASIMDIKGNDIKECDLMTYSFPCFSEETFITTSTGYKFIKDVKIGDYVLTHKNTFQKVLNTMKRKSDNIYNIKIYGIDEIKATSEHPFYIRTKNKLKYSEPQWKDVKDLEKQDFIGIAINNKNELPVWNGIEHTKGQKKYNVNTLTENFNKENFWWIVGRYLGDGWTRLYTDKKILNIIVQ